MPRCLPLRLLVLLLLARPLAAAEPGWLARSWLAEDGLLNNDVTALAQARDGAMLFANQRGLSRFDGRRWREVPTDVPGRSGRSVTGLFPARDGTLWMVTRSVVVAQRPGGEQRVFTMPAVNVAGAPVSAFFEQPGGVVWLAFENGRLHRIEGNSIIQAPVAPELSPTFASTATIDRASRVWAAGSGTLAQWRNERFEPVATIPSGRAAIAPAPSGLWIGVGRKLLRSDEAGAITPVGELPPEMKSSRINHLLEDREGRLWVGTSRHGLLRWAGRDFQATPLVESDIRALGEDHEGNIWAAPGGQGVARLRPRVLSLLDEPRAPMHQVPRSLCRDLAGNIWVATTSGQLFVRRADGWRDFAPDRDWPATKAASLAAAANGDVWIGTGDGNLVRWDGQTFTLVPLPPDPQRAPILALLATREGEIWIARGHSALHGQPGAWREIGVATGSIYTLAQDAAGRIWAGTVSGALLRAQGETLSPDPASPLKTHGGGIRTLLPTADGALWIGSEGGGIARLANGQCRAATTAKGLPHDVISQLVLDGENRFWAGSDLGIFMVPLAQLTAVLEDRARHLQATAFGRGEGLAGLHATGGGALVTPDGRVWFSTQAGIVVADPSLVGSNRTPPPVAIESMRANGELVTPPARIGPGASQVQFELSAMSFAAPEHVRLFHRLEDLDRDWVATPADGVASYAHLPPGSYRLRVQAENNDGVPSAREATLEFTVRPFVWQTLWFRSGAVLLALVATAFLVHRAMARRARRQAEALRRETAIERERTRIARDMHDQLGASLTRISLLSDLAQSDTPNPHLPQLAATAHEAVTALDEIVWAVNPRHDTLASLLEYLGQQATELLRPAGIRCRLEFPDHPAARPLSAEFRHHLFLIVREAINNAIRHSGASDVRLAVEPQAEGLRVVVADNGRGRDAAASGGHGLTNLRARAEELGGTCTFESQPGAGTTVRVFLPWPPEPR